MKNFAHYIILISLLTTNLSCRQGNSEKKAISEQTKKIVNQLEKLDRVDCESIGYAGSPSGQFETYKNLCDTATDAELVQLTDYSSNAVKCYAFQALGYKNNIDLFPILLKHLKDTTTIQTFCGCIISTHLTGDYFIDVVTPDRIGNEKYHISEKQKQLLDSILIFQDGIILSAKADLLRELKPEQKYYKRIRQIVISEKNPVAVLTLAKYKNQNDIEIIRRLYGSENTEYYAAYATREFPHDEFYPLLVKLFEKEWAKELYDYPLWRIIYQALAKYPSAKTYELFERTIKTKDDFRYQTLGTDLMMAITKYPNKMFEPLKEKIQLDGFNKDEIEQQINIEL